VEIELELDVSDCELEEDDPELLDDEELELSSAAVAGKNVRPRSRVGAWGSR
jgi:hypothetical protein